MSPAMLTGESTLTMLDYSASTPLTRLHRARTEDQVIGLQARADQYHCSTLMQIQPHNMGEVQGRGIREEGQGETVGKGVIQQGKSDWGLSKIQMFANRAIHYCPIHNIPYYLIMRPFLLLPLTLLSLLLPASGEEMTLTYITQHELDQADNYVQASLTLHLEGASLQQTIAQAEETILQIKKIAQQYCKTHAKDKSSKQACGSIVDVSQYEVSAKYHNIRKVKTFSSFLLEHQLTIAIHHTANIGRLIDQVLAAGGEDLVLNELVWKAQQEEDAELQAIREGREQGEEICAKFGKKLVEVISVEELEEEEEEQDEEQEERDEDLAEVQVEVTTMRFKVKCDDLPK